VIGCEDFPQREYFFRELRRLSMGVQRRIVRIGHAPPRQQLSLNTVCPEGQGGWDRALVDYGDPWNSEEVDTSDG